MYSTLDSFYELTHSNYFLNEISNSVSSSLDATFKVNK